MSNEDWSDGGRSVGSKNGSAGFLTRDEDADRNVRAPLLYREPLDDGFYLFYRFELLDFADQGFGLFFRDR